jgi:hypothetical protein
MKGNCFIDIDGIYDFHCLQTFFSYQSMKRIGLLKVGFLFGVHWMEFADTTLGISEQCFFFCHQTGVVGH